MVVLKSRPLLIALGAHIAVLCFAVPRSPWEFDEPLFFQALRDYDPLAHHPPPPGYPLFILFAQLVHLVIQNDFGTLVTISFAASIIGFVMLALAFRNLSGDETTGIIGATLFYFSPAMLIHSTLPISEPGALALLATALYFSTKPSPILFALFAALTIGWRIQFAIFVLPLFLVTVVLMRTWRARVVALLVFTIVCLAWLTPLTIAVGGVRELIDFETGQGKYLAAHDAAESRTGWTPVRIAFRFIGRAWGTEVMALAVLAIAAIGFFAIVRKKAAGTAALLVAAAVYIGFALWVMDPADGVRYAIPFVLATAFVAGVGAVVIARRFAYAIPILGATAFLAYVGPLLAERRIMVSPPIRAARMAAAMCWPDLTVVLYEPPLWPHAIYYLRDHDPHRIEEGLEKFYDRPDVPLLIYADGATQRKDAWVFRWHDTDAYRKLTRNHYRAVSVIPLPPERRFRGVEGVYAQERDQDGREWRWLAPSAQIQLPNGGARRVILHIGLPVSSPLAENTIIVNGVRTVVGRGRTTEVVIDVAAGAPIIRLESAQSFIPAEVPSMRSGDRRRLAVELYDLRTTPAAAPTPPPPVP